MVISTTGVLVPGKHLVYHSNDTINPKSGFDNISFLQC